LASRQRLLHLASQAMALHLSLLRAVCAQTADGSRRVEIGGTIGVALIAVAGAQTVGFCNFLTGSEEKPALGLRGGYRLKKWLVVEGTIEHVLRDFGGNEGAAVCAILRYPRLTGADTLTADFPSNESGGFQTAITTARVALVPWSTSWAEVRLYGGIGRIWQLRVFSAVAGLDSRVLVGNVYLLVEVEAARYSVPFTHSARFYQDGTLVRTQEIMIPSRQRLDATLRIGVGLCF